MNQRREPRFQTDQMVDVTVFGEPEIHLQALLRNASGRGVGLVVEGPLKTGTALKISLPDAILLGEVIYCRAEGNKWYLGVELEHALCGLAELAATLRDFADEYLGPERPDAVQHTRRQNE